MQRIARQLSLFIPKTKRIFGGSLLKNSNPKEPRPISTKHAMHVVLRSSHATGRRSFLRKRNREKIDRVLRRQARRWGIRLYRYENVGNHIHLIIKGIHRARIIGFLRSISGLIARAVLGVERGKPLGIKFWDARPFSRVVEWGWAYKNLLKYLDKNRQQAIGFDIVSLEKHLTMVQGNTS